MAEEGARVSIADFAEIIPTWAMSNEEWLNLRSTGLGGSDSGTICGLNRYSSKFKLFNEKLGRIPRDEQNDAMRWGQVLEKPIAIMFAESEEEAVVEWPVALRSKLFNWLIGNIDFWVVDPSDEFPVGQVTTWQQVAPPPGVRSVLEIKSTGVATPGTPHKWTNGQVPDSYITQGVCYGIASGVHDVVFAAMIPGQGLVVRRPAWDDDLAEEVIGAMGDFWEMLITRTEPEPDGSDATETALKLRYPRSVPEKVYEGDETFAKLWDRYLQAKAAYSEAETERKKARADLAAKLGDAEMAVVDGTPICTFKSNKDSDYFNESKFKAEHPRLYRQYLESKPGARQIRECK